MGYLASTKKIRKILESHTKKRDNSALVLMALGVFVVFETRKMEIGNFGNPGPGLFPLLLGIMLLIFSIALLFQSKVKEDKYATERILMGNVYSVLGVLLFFVFGLMLFGYSITTFLMFVFLFKLIGDKNWIFSIVWATIITGFSYLVFVRWLLVLFPKGILLFQ